MAIFVIFLIITVILITIKIPGCPEKRFSKEKSDLRGAEGSASLRQGCVLTAHGDTQHITSALRRQEYLRDYNIMLGILYIHRFRALGFLQFVLEHSHDYDSIVSLLIHTQYIQLTWSSWWNIDHFHFLPGLPSFHCHLSVFFLQHAVHRQRCFVPQLICSSTDIHI